MAVVPKNLYGMIPDLLNILNLKMLGGLHKKQRAIKGVHIPMSPAAHYTGTVFPQAK